MSDWVVTLFLSSAVGLIAYFVGRGRGAQLSGEKAEAPEEDLARQINDLRSLQELSFNLSESLDVDRIVKQVVAHLARSIRTDGIVLAVADGGALPLTVRAAQGTMAVLSGRIIREREAGLIGEAMGAEHLQVAHASERDVPQLLKGVSVQTAAVAPLRAHGVTIGALAAVRDSLAPFDSDDLRQLSTVASHAAVVLENARLFALVTAGKHQWETTFDALGEGIAVLDGEDRIRRANRVLSEMVGKPIPAVVGADLLRVVTGDVPAVREYLAGARTGRATSTLTFRSERLGRTIRIAAAPFPSSHEGWLVALIEDVTEREALEAQLIQSEKMAAVGQLVSGVAHELNNPLSSIAGVSDLLLGRESTGEGDRPHLALIHEQAERAGRIVRNLLSFARKDPSGKTVIDLNEVAQSAAALVAHDARLGQIDLEVVPGQPPPTVRGNRHELQQAALNLLTNAIQAVAKNPQGRPRRVRVATSFREQKAILSVVDSGPGIPDDLASQIFLPFFTTKAPGEGTGLGLSITYRIVESHGGRISVLRTPDGGSELVVSLPHAESETEVAPQTTPTDREGDLAAKGPQPTGRVLLVDDDAAVRRSLHMLLAHDGHTVTPAASAAEATALIRTNTYEVVIVESHLSSGQTYLAQALLDEWPELATKMLLTSGDVRPDTEEWLRNSGCTYLRKPATADELRSAVSAILVQAGASSTSK